MYGILTNICPKNHPNVGKYTMYGAHGNGFKEKNLFWIARHVAQRHLREITAVKAELVGGF